MITFHVESFDQFLPEAQLLFQDHFDEISLNKEVLVKPNMDVEAYRRIEAAGQLHIVNARFKGKLIGYHISFVRPHLHYSHSLTAIADLYYIMPEYRVGMVGIGLFQEVEKTLRVRGVERMFTGTKLHKDMGKIFEYLGWSETERLYSKVIR